MAQARPGPGRHWRWALALSLVLLLAAVLRIPGLHWELPDAQHPGYSGHPDEAGHYIFARMLAQGQLIPPQFMYGGTFYFVLLNACYHYARLLGGVLGGAGDFANTILFARYVFTACSLLSVLLTWRIGLRLFDPGRGLLAALFLALSPAHAFLAQVMRPDELGTLLALLLLWMGVLVLRGQPARDRLYFAVTGALAGLALALRFPLAVFALAPVLAFLLRDGGAWGERLAALLRWRLPLLLALALPAYALASPQTLLHPDLLQAGLRFQQQYQLQAFPDAAERGPGIYQYGWLTLRQALGTPLHLLALAGVLLAALRANAARLIVLAPLLAYFASLTLVSWVVVRYTLPMLPLLALLGADAMFGLAAGGTMRRRLAAAAAAGLIAWTLLGDAAFLRIQAGRNAREAALDWIEANIPKGASIVQVQQYLNDVFLCPEIPPGYRRVLFRLDLGGASRLLDAGADHDFILVNADSYRNMDRLGARDPQPGVPALQQVLDSGRYRLAAEITVPVRLLGVDFSEQFTSQDFNIINPGQRIYRYVGAPAPG
jgi:hypothetical protein